MCFAGSLARFGGYRGSTPVSTPRAPGWVTFFATTARPRNIHLDRALGGCQHERNINGREGRGKRREEYFAVARLLCFKRNIENLSAIQEKSGYLLRQTGRRAVCRQTGSNLSWPGINNGKSASRQQ